jgi:hypothetical protein
MKILFAAASAAALLAAVPAAAQTVGQPGLYGTIGYMHLSTDLEGDFDENGTEDSFDIDVGAVTGRFGGRFTPYLGAEAELSFGVRDSEDSQQFTVSGVTVDADVSVELKNQFAAYGVGFLPVSPNADLFARVGYGRGELDGTVRVSGGGTTLTEELEGDNSFWAYGVGGQFMFDGVNGVRVDYTRYDIDEEDAGEFDAFSIAYVRKFR